MLDVGSKDVDMLVIVWAAALVLLRLLALAVRSPWGRVLRSIREDEDAAALARQERLRLQAPVARASARRSAASPGSSTPGSSRSSAPDDFAPLLDLLRLDDRHPRRARRAIWAVPVGALVFGVIFAGTRFFDFAPFSLLRLGRARLPAPDRDRARS